MKRFARCIAMLCLVMAAMSSLAIPAFAAGLRLRAAAYRARGKARRLRVTVVRGWGGDYIRLGKSRSFSHGSVSVPPRQGGNMSKPCPNREVGRVQSHVYIFYKLCA